MKRERVQVRELLAPLIISQAGVTPPPPPPTPTSSGIPSPDLSGVLWLLMKKKPKKPKLDFLRLLKIHKALGTLDLFLSMKG